MAWLSPFLERTFRPCRTKSAAVPQHPSGFGLFVRLPFEIRHMIYLYALGDVVLELTENDLWKQCKRYGFSNLPSFSTNKRVSFFHRLVGNPHILCLLLTCRQIYAEASAVLYATNTFKVFDITVVSLPETFCQVRTNHLEMISSICVDTQVDGLNSGTKKFVQLNWTKTWDFLARHMPGLKHLEVRLVKNYLPSLKLTLEEEWVEPMLDVRGLRSFKFDISQNLGSEESTAKYNENLEWFQKELSTLMCSAKSDALC